MEDFAEEILVNIFANLIYSKEILSVRSVCHRWNNLVLNDLQLTYHYTFAFGEVMHSLSIGRHQKLKSSKFSRFTPNLLNESDLVVAIVDAEIELKYSKRRDLQVDTPQLSSILREIHAVLLDNKISIRLLIAPDEQLNFVSDSEVSVFGEFPNFTLKQAVINLFEITDNRLVNRDDQTVKLQRLFNNCTQLERLGILPISTLVGLQQRCQFANLTHLDIAFGRKDLTTEQNSIEWVAKQFENLRFIRIRTCKPLNYCGLKFASHLKHLRFDLINLRSDESPLFWSQTNFDICLPQVVSMEIDFNLLTDVSLGDGICHLFLMTPNLKTLSLLTWNVDILYGLLEALKFGCYRQLENLSLTGRTPTSNIAECAVILRNFLSTPNELPKLNHLKVFKVDLKNVQPDNSLLLSLIQSSPKSLTKLEANFYLPHNLLTGWTDKITDFPIFEQEILPIVAALNCSSISHLSCLCVVKSFNYSRSGIISNCFKKLSASSQFPWKDVLYREQLAMEDHQSCLIAKLNWTTLENVFKTIEIRFQF